MDSRDITQNLNKEQLAAVTHDRGPLLIVAGAGTGKTTVLTQRLAWLVLEGKTKADEILAVTFTDKAAGEMAERVDQLLPTGYTDLWVSTFHALCEKMLQRHGLDIGLPNDFSVLDSTAQWLLVRQNLDRFELDYYKPLGSPTKFIHALLDHFSRAKDEGIWPKDYAELVNKKTAAVKRKKNTDEEEGQELQRLQEVARAYQVYQDLLLENNVLDFGDLINYTLKLLQDRPAIRKKYQEQFKYVLVDEFQDTNWAQYQLVRLFAEPHNNLTVVGDDDQAIYRFRGASVSNILEFRRDYPTAKQIVLTQNYRSCQNILDAAYNFIQHNNPYRLEYKMQSAPTVASQAKRQKVTEQALAPISKRLAAARTDKGVFEHLSFATGAQEVSGVLQAIVDRKAADKTLQWSDFAILVRANSHAKPFTVALGKAGIPFTFFALRGLYAKEPILDVASYFKLLDNYHESPALWRVLNIPTMGIPERDLIELTHQERSRSRSLYESIEHAAVDSRLSQKTLERLNWLLSLLAKHTKLAVEKTVSELFVIAWTDLGIFNYYKDREEELSREALGYLRQWYGKLKQFEESTDEPTLKQFMARLNLELEAGDEGSLEFDLESGPDTVRVMTVHAAKGLEFAHVFVVNLVQQRFPTSERGEAISLPNELIHEVLPEGDIHTQEERRLFYVAMTRAKRGLYLTAAKDYGGSRQKKPSRFLDELGLLTDNVSSAEQTDPLKVTPTIARKSSPLPLPKKFAFSQLSSYAKCPLQYKYAYVLKIPTFGKSSLSFGSTMHNTLQKFFELFTPTDGRQANLFSSATELPPLSRLLELYKQQWIDAWYKNKTEQKDFYAKGEQILTQYHATLSKNMPQSIMLERPFTLKVGKQSIAGRIDRIDRLADGGIEIIDYKTGQAKEKVVDDDKDQLLIYQLAAEQTLNLVPTKLTYYYLNDDRAVSFLGTEKDKEKIEEKILTTIEQIKTGDFSPTPGWACRYCDYRDICQYRDGNG